MVASNIDSYNAIAYLQQGRLRGMKPGPQLVGLSFV